MKIGFIGYGSMGSMLINSMLESRAMRPEQCYVSTKTQDKLIDLKTKYQGIIITSNIGVAKEADLLFICVKPNLVIDILNEIKKDINRSCHVVSIAGCVTVSNVESIISNKVSKFIPTVTSEVHEGISLLCHGARVDEPSSAILNQLLGTISYVRIIDESEFEIMTDLTSCAPGLIATMFNCMATAAMKHTTRPKSEIEDILIKTLYGSSKLMKDKSMSFEETYGRVATKGGITEEGAKVLNKGLPLLFDEMLNATLSKHVTRKNEIRKMFENNMA